MFLNQNLANIFKNLLENKLEPLRYQVNGESQLEEVIYKTEKFFYIFV